MGPLLPIIGLTDLIIAAIAIRLITLSIAHMIYQALRLHQMTKEDATKVQGAIEQTLKHFFGPQDLLKDLPVRGDVILPGEKGIGEIIPLKVGLERSMTNSGPLVWLQDPLRPFDYGHRIITLFPAMSRYPSMSDLPSTQPTGTNPFYPNGPPPETSGSTTPTFPELPVLSDITPFCRPWPPHGPFWDPENGGGAGAVAPVPIMAVAVGGAETKRQDVLEGVAGRVPHHPVITVYPKSLPVIGAGDEKSAITTRGYLENKSRFTLLMRKDGDKRAAFASHGFVLANSIVCFPGQKIEIGGISDGAGVEVAFRFQVWDIPHVSDRNSFPSEIKSAVDHIENDPRGLQAFVMKPETSNWVSNLYCFIDIPKVGSSKVNCFETSKEDVKELKDKISDVAGDYNFLSGTDHHMTGANLKATFSVEYGSHPAAKFFVENTA